MKKIYIAILGLVLLGSASLALASNLYDWRLIASFIIPKTTEVGKVEVYVIDGDNGDKCYVLTATWKESHISCTSHK